MRSRILIKKGICTFCCGICKCYYSRLLSAFLICKSTNSIIKASIYNNGIFSVILQQFVVGHFVTFGRVYIKQIANYKICPFRSVNTFK